VIFMSNENEDMPENCKEAFNNIKNAMIENIGDYRFLSAEFKTTGDKDTSITMPTIIISVDADTEFEKPKWNEVFANIQEFEYCIERGVEVRIIRE
jgi:hypothetical protein